MPLSKSIPAEEVRRSDSAINIKGNRGVNGSMNALDSDQKSALIEVRNDKAYGSVDDSSYKRLGSRRYQGPTLDLSSFVKFGPDTLPMQPSLSPNDFSASAYVGSATNKKWKSDEIPIPNPRTSEGEYISKQSALSQGIKRHPAVEKESHSDRGQESLFDGKDQLDVGQDNSDIEKNLDSELKGLHAFGRRLEAMQDDLQAERNRFSEAKTRYVKQETGLDNETHADRKIQRPEKRERHRARIENSLYDERLPLSQWQLSQWQYKLVEMQRNFDDRKANFEAWESLLKTYQTRPGERKNTQKASLDGPRSPTGHNTEESYTAPVNGSNHHPLTSKPVAFNVLIQAMSRLRNLLDQCFPRPTSPGEQIIVLTCPCGRRVRGRYRETATGGLRELQTLLRKLEVTAERRVNSSETNAIAGIKAPNSVMNVMVAAIRAVTVWKTTTQTLPTSNPPLEMASSGSIRSLPFNVEDKHLLLVLPVMDRGTKLEHAISPNIDSDENLFTTIGEHYRRSRGVLRRVLSLKTLADIYFVEFALLRGGIPRVHHRDVVPPAHDTSYEYKAVPWSPPIDSNHFIHFVEHPWLASKESYMSSWVPKKRNGKLECPRVEEYRNGWGIQYVERLDRARVCALVFISAITSILFALLWTILKQDISGGFTTGGTVFIVLTSGVGSLEAFFGSRMG